MHHTLALFSFWLKDIGLSVTYRDSSYKQQDNLLLKVETTMDLESMECWDGTWDDCQVAEEGKACSLEVSRLSLVKMMAIYVRDRSSVFQRSEVPKEGGKGPI